MVHDIRKCTFSLHHNTPIVQLFCSIPPLSAIMPFYILMERFTGLNKNVTRRSSPLLCKWRPSERPSLGERFCWQNAPKRHAQQCSVHSGLGWRGAEVSQLEFHKIHLAVYCCTFFTVWHLAGSWVHTYLLILYRREHL